MLVWGRPHLMALRVPLRAPTMRFASAVSAGSQSTGGAQVNVEQCCPGGAEPDDMAGLGAEVDVIVGIEDRCAPDLGCGRPIVRGF